MATISIPDVKASLRRKLRGRPALAGVPVHLVDRRAYGDPEAIVLSRVVMSGARWLGWGPGPASYATVEQLQLDGYLFVRVAGAGPDDDSRAEARAGELLGELVQELRDDPTVGMALAGQVRYRPPIVDSAVWGSWPGDADGAAIIRVRVDFRVTWQAVDA